MNPCRPPRNSADKAAEPSNASGSEDRRGGGGTLSPKSELEIVRKIEKKIDKIVLIGYRAAGKSTLARRLASLSNLALHSSDRIIEERVGMALSAFVEQQGWSAFREIEVQVIRKLCRMPSIIVDCGGGVATSPDAMHCLAARGMLVHVFANIDVVRARLQAQPRPLLTAANVEDDIASTFDARERLYQRWADLRVDNGNANPDEVAQKIWQVYRQAALDAQT